MKPIGVPKHFENVMFQFEAEGTRKFFSKRLVSDWNLKEYGKQFPPTENKKTILFKYYHDLDWLESVDLPREIVNYINHRKREVDKEINDAETSSNTGNKSCDNAKVVFYAPYNNGFVGVAKTSSIKPTTTSTTSSGSSTPARIVMNAPDIAAKCYALPVVQPFLQLN
ncbi:hypothetical protein BDC45DRAFT_239296 [Circinella umbellata]|nr:hypothetical protein BDC45DRAFT_239296 [Circinella umbellata]